VNQLLVFLNYLMGVNLERVARNVADLWIEPYYLPTTTHARIKVLPEELDWLANALRRSNYAALAFGLSCILGKDFIWRICAEREPLSGNEVDAIRHHGLFRYVHALARFSRDEWPGTAWNTIAVEHDSSLALLLRSGRFNEFAILADVTNSFGRPDARSIEEQKAIQLFEALLLIQRPMTIDQDTEVITKLATLTFPYSGLSDASTIREIAVDMAAQFTNARAWSPAAEVMLHIYDLLQEAPDAVVWNGENRIEALRDTTSHSLRRHLNEVWYLPSRPGDLPAWVGARLSYDDISTGCPQCGSSLRACETEMECLHCDDCTWCGYPDDECVSNYVRIICECVAVTPSPSAFVAPSAELQNDTAKMIDLNYELRFLIEIGKAPGSDFRQVRRRSSDQDIIDFSPNAKWSKTYTITARFPAADDSVRLCGFAILQ
jgi:hypothetical protein